MGVIYGWDEVLAKIASEQGGREDLRVAIYPCAPLLCLEAGMEPIVDHLAGALVAG